MANPHRRFRQALVQVLERLPEAVYDRVERQVLFVVDDPGVHMAAATKVASSCPSRERFCRKELDLMHDLLYSCPISPINKGCIFRLFRRVPAVQ